METIENEAKTINSVAFSIDNTTESIDNDTRTVNNRLLLSASVLLLTVVVAKALADASDWVDFTGQLAVPCFATLIFGESWMLNETERMVVAAITVRVPTFSVWVEINRVVSISLSTCNLNFGSGKR